MGALSVTTTSIIKPVAATSETVTAGEAVTIGQAVYRHSNGKYKLTDADVESSSEIAGIALTQAAASGQPLVICTAGDLPMKSSGITVGTAYYVHTTPGAIALIGDLSSGDYVSLVGIAISATTLRLDFLVTGVTVP
jgi:hypothetical protein